MTRKSNKQRWNRTHVFRRRKSTKNKVGHPVYVYGTSKRTSKYLVFTHTPENNIDYVMLKHNIDQEDEGKTPTYMKKKFETCDSSHLRNPDKQYRIHPDDRETIKKYKK